MIPGFEGGDVEGPPEWLMSLHGIAVDGISAWMGNEGQEGLSVSCRQMTASD